MAERCQIWGCAHAPRVATIRVVEGERLMVELCSHHRRSTEPASPIYPFTSAEGA